MEYPIEIAGVKRILRLFPVSDKLQIAAFILLGDVEMSVCAAQGLLERVPGFDVIVTPEAKSIPLAHEMSRQSGKPYLVARKGLKVYMSDVLSNETRSITTAHDQTLYLDGGEAAQLCGKKVLLVDDVVSTGATLRSLAGLVGQAGGEIVGAAAVLAEGDAAKRSDIVFLEALPLFDGDGNSLLCE